MSTEATCFYFKYGHCKRGEYCWKQHVEIKCESIECDGRKCEKRHPRVCRFYNDYGRCKSGESCSYNHIDRDNPVLEELKLVKVKLNLVEAQIISKNLEFKLLFEKLELALSKEEFNENSDNTMDNKQEKSPGFITKGDSGMDTNSQGSPAGNDEEDKPGRRKEKKKKKEKNDDNKSRQVSELGSCDDSQAAQFDSGVISSMLEDLEAPPLFVFEDDDDDQDPEYVYAVSSSESDGSLYYEFKSETELESADYKCVDSELDYGY